MEGKKAQCVQLISLPSVNTKGGYYSFSCPSRRKATLTASIRVAYDPAGGEGEVTHSPDKDTECCVSLSGRSGCGYHHDFQPLLSIPFPSAARGPCVQTHNCTPGREPMHIAPAEWRWCERVHSKGPQSSPLADTIPVLPKDREWNDPFRAIAVSPLLLLGSLRYALTCPLLLCIRTLLPGLIIVPGRFLPAMRI